LDPAATDPAPGLPEGIRLGARATSRMEAGFIGC
jgi:hypothetical protein